MAAGPADEQYRVDHLAARDDRRRPASTWVEFEEVGHQLTTARRTGRPRSSWPKDGRPPRQLMWHKRRDPNGGFRLQALSRWQSQAVTRSGATNAASSTHRATPRYSREAPISRRSSMESRRPSGTVGEHRVPEGRVPLGEIAVREYLDVGSFRSALACVLHSETVVAATGVAMAEIANVVAATMARIFLLTVLPFRVRHRRLPGASRGQPGEHEHRRSVVNDDEPGRARSHGWGSRGDHDRRGRAQAPSLLEGVTVEDDVASPRASFGTSGVASWSSTQASSRSVTRAR